MRRRIRSRVGCERGHVGKLMSGLADIGADLLAVAAAIGLVTRDSQGEWQMYSDFFEHPLQKLRTLLTDASQQTALLQALELLAPAQSAQAPAGTVHYHPLLSAGGPGQLYLTVAISASGQSDRVELGIAGELASQAAGPTTRLTAEVPLIRATNQHDASGKITSTTLEVLLEAQDGTPLRVALSVPLDALGSEITAAILIGGQSAVAESPLGMYQVQVTRVD
jgi:hypothetical protein